jgi:hypothetical protein
MVWSARMTLAEASRNADSILEEAVEIYGKSLEALGINHRGVYCQRSSELILKSDRVH